MMGGADLATGLLPLAPRSLVPNGSGIFPFGVQARLVDAVRQWVVSTLYQRH